MSHRVPITLRLDAFEGPLDLLLYLIQSHELNISRISLTQITDQYLAYVKLMQELNFDVASDFLVMAATLIHWKSKAILPQETLDGATTGAQEDEELTPEQLLKQLLDHQRFLQAGQDIAQLPKLGEDVFAKTNAKPPVEKIWKTLDLTSLTLAYQENLLRARKRTQVLKKETVSIAEKIKEFAHKLEIGIPTEMSKLLSAAPSRPEIVATFLASLELARLKRLRLYQQETYQEIYLELLETLIGFDPTLAVGFEAAVNAGLAAMPPIGAQDGQMGAPAALNA